MTEGPPRLPKLQLPLIDLPLPVNRKVLHQVLAKLGLIGLYPERESAMTDGQKPLTLKRTSIELPLNGLPLNQAAKKALVALGEKADPEILYAYQLISWLVEKHKPLVPNDLEDMREMVEQLSLVWKPENAMKYLSQSVNGPDETLLPSDQEISEAEPTELATLLTFALRDKMSATIPGFPTKVSNAQRSQRTKPTTTYPLIEETNWIGGPLAGPPDFGTYDPPAEYKTEPPSTCPKGSPEGQEQDQDSSSDESSG